MRYGLKTKLSLAIALVVLLTVALISLLANIFIGNQFKGYITNQQQKSTQEIVNRISQQYDTQSKKWDVDFLHTIGMYALYDGYIVKVYDLEQQVIWDAETSDMKLCTEVMNDISHRMMMEYPEMNGQFTTKEFSAMQETEKVGTVQISSFGPFFLSKDDFQFLDSLNKILISIGLLSLLISIIVGFLLAKRLSQPIMETVRLTKQISNGDYGVKIEEKTSTKEVQELIESINHLSGTLESQEKLRRQLTTDVAHELRTPLTTAQTHLEAIMEGVWEPTMERLQSCYDEMSRICELVSDLESLAKVESDNFKLDKTWISPLELSQKVLENFETELKNKHQKTSVTGSASEIFADKARISQVLINLISNAVKYSPDGSEMQVTISETQNTVVFSIKDNGIGIPENEIPFIFERFYRADKSRNRLMGGSGIGLAIVKSIVTAHGGKVEVESRLNEGSCFIVTLPKLNEIDLPSKNNY
ncbi:ATP-binding protein [Clostridium aminobutyricum]|uniref:histidine kinase n=1 Tax=Clostridium aminobutyricum TaxID=33953 RepID=A0A939D6T0_CLOAM|nr:ATP-binding protein [Clostridium aminobutyricum]MBN7772489.1 ATP-binding protein [Clostridium aminobutyricum]